MQSFHAEYYIARSYKCKWYSARNHIHSTTFVYWPFHCKAELKNYENIALFCWWRYSL